MITLSVQESISKFKTHNLDIRLGIRLSSV